jgi:ABC-2 type transport system permease protein
MGLAVDSFTLFKREMLVFRSNLRTNLMRSVMFPVVIILFLGNLGFSISNIPAAVVNYANNVQSSQFITALTLNKEISVQTITTQQDAMSLLNSGTVDFVIVILPGFPNSINGNPSVMVYYPNNQFSVEGAVLPLIQSSAQKFGTSVYQPQKSVSTVSATAINGATGSYKDFILSGVIAMVVIFGSFFGGGVSLISDRQLGNLKQFLVAPINKNAIVLGKLMAGGVQSILYGMIALVIGLLNGSHIAMGLFGILWIIAISVLLSIAFTALALVIATRIRKFEVYVIAVQGIALPLWFLSGGLLPIQSLPSWLYPVAIINPVTYAVDGLRYVILQGVYPLNSMLIDLGVLTVFIAIVLYLSLRMMKDTIE